MARSHQHLAAAEIDGEHLSDEEVFSFLRLLLPAGVENSRRDPEGKDPHIRGQVFWSPTSLAVVFGVPRG